MDSYVNEEEKLLSHFYRFVGVFGAIACAGLGVAQVGSAAREHSAAHAKSMKFTATCDGKLVGSNVTKGICHSTLGTYPFVDTLSPPTETETDTHKNGKVYTRGTVKLSTVNGHAEANGPYKITGGTGAYKHVSGGGHQTTILNGPNTVTKVTGTIKI